MVKSPKLFSTEAVVSPVIRFKSVYHCNSTTLQMQYFHCLMIVCYVEQMIYLTTQFPEHSDIKTNAKSVLFLVSYLS